MSIVTISGYWKDTKKKFNRYKVSTENHHPDQEFNDEDIFYYGLSIEEIEESIDLGENTKLEFVITEIEY